MSSSRSARSGELLENTDCFTPTPSLGHLKNQFDLDDNTTMELGASALSGFGTDGLHHLDYGTDLTFRNVPLRQSNQRGWILQMEYLARDAWNNDGSFSSHEADG